MAASLPPWGFWPLAFLGIALFELSLGARPSRRRRLVHGGLFGAAWMAMGMGWMWFLTAPGYLVAIAVFGSFHALAALVAPSGPWRMIGRPIAHTLVEAVRLVWPFGGVPLATLGIGQAGGPFLGLAGVIGVIGLTWATFQIGTSLAGPTPVAPRLVAAASVGSNGSGPVPTSALALRGPWHGTIGLALVAVLVMVAWFAPRGVDSGRTLTIAAVQGGGEQGTSALDVPALLVTERHLAATAGVDADTPLDLVLWPENVITLRDEPFEGSWINDLVADEARRLDVPISTGITERAHLTGRGGPDRFTNAQVVVTPDGSVVDRYDKVRRVPFGEYVPLRGLLERFGVRIPQIPRDAISGTGPAVLDVPLAGDRGETESVRLAVAISWEVFFAPRVRDGVLEGGEVIVNPTNGASYTGTVLQTQQIASSRLRAVETGRWVVQAAPTGFSAFVSPSGQVLQRSAISEQIVLIESIALRTGLTWYTRLGDGPLVVLLLAGLALTRWRGGDASRLRSLRARSAP